MSGGISIVGGTAGAGRSLALLPQLPDSPAPDKANFAERLDAAEEAGPPPEVRAEVEAAARAANRLHELGRELHFDRNPENGEITIEVRDLDGNVLRRVPPSEVFDFASGRTVE